MTLTIATFNIWFDNYMKYERANQVILEILFNKPRIDIICLQEITPSILEFIKLSLITKYYTLSKDKITQSYDTLILVNKNLTIVNTIIKKFRDTKMARCLEILHVKKDNYNYLVSTAHLESEFKINSTNQSKLNQFIEIFEILNNLEKDNNNIFDYCFFLGDTNIIPSEDKEFQNNTPKEWIDYFIEFGSPKHLEYTYDYSKNNNVLYKKKSRLDRIYYKSKPKELKKENDLILEPYSFSFLGQEPSIINLYSSDHFGLVATFMFV